MRKAFSRQGHLDGSSVLDVQLNLNCRDEIIPVLRALQHIYATPKLRDKILMLIEQDVLGEGSAERGREGLDYWQILVLAAVRLGCNLDYDCLQDLAENHRNLRSIMGLGEWKNIDFASRRIRDNLCLLTPETIEAISHALVAEGQRLVPEAVERVRADSFVVETNIHYPTDSSLIVDGIRKVIELCVPLAGALGLEGWRQHEQLLKAVCRVARKIDRIAAKKGPNYKQRLETAYAKLLKKSGRVLVRARALCAVLQKTSSALAGIGDLTTLMAFIDRTDRVRDVARRRVIHGETVPNSDKLFSIFEPHTQLYKRGKAGEPVQFGRLVLVYEDVAGFIMHHHLMARDVGDRDVAIEQTRLVQARYGGKVKELSFDRGFHSPDNQTELSELVESLCLPKPGPKQAAEQAATASVTFHRARQRHPGIESAIGALQSGNGLERCRDHGETGFERYLALGILGRNLHVLGRVLIARENAECEAGRSQRAA
jgi:IS5 family transposase